MASLTERLTAHRAADQKHQRAVLVEMLRHDTIEPLSELLIQGLSDLADGLRVPDWCLERIAADPAFAQRFIECNGAAEAGGQ